MGGFLLAKGNFEAEKKYHNSLKVFEQRGLKLSKRISFDNYSLFIFDKYSFTNDNNFLNIGEDFICSLGTCIYKNSFGKIALEKLYNDFIDPFNFFESISGTYSVIIYKQNKLYIFNDFVGLYKIYYDKKNQIYTSSFLALVKSLNTLEISFQELYEYCLIETSYGDKTIFKNINLLDSKNIWEIGNNSNKGYVKKYTNNNKLIDPTNFNKSIEQVSNQLIQYFKVLKNIFDNDITSALSGGYDSRLMYAIMKKADIDPVLYVYLSGNKSKLDVEIATEIAKGESLQLEVIDRTLFPHLSVNDFVETISKQFYMFDGLHDLGVFDNGSDIETRLERVKKAKLQLNGGGGGIYRNWQHIPNNTFYIKDYAASYFGFIDYSICKDRFNKDQYLELIENKIKNALNADKDIINRRDVEMLFPFFRMKYWMGINNSLNNSLSYALTPYAEPDFFLNSLDIPFRFKSFGKFEAGLIKYLNPKLAHYNSSYGFNFYNSISYKDKLNNQFKNFIPMKYRIYRKKRKYNTLPYYLSKTYLERIFNFNDLAMNEFFNVSIINNSQLLSRILTVELLINQKF